MGVVGKSPNQRCRVSVKTSSSENLEFANADTPSPQQVAAYIAEMCVELLYQRLFGSTHMCPFPHPD